MQDYSKLSNEELLSFYLMIKPYNPKFDIFIEEWKGERFNGIRRFIEIVYGKDSTELKNATYLADIYQECEKQIIRRWIKSISGI